MLVCCVAPQLPAPFSNIPTVSSPATHLPAASLCPQGAKLASGEGKGSGAGAADGVGGGMRTFREVILGEPIR